MLVTSETFDANMILAGLGVGSGGSGAPPTPLVADKMHLFTNNIAPTKTNLVADFTEPTYTGYVAQALTYTLPKRDNSGNISADTGLVTFQMSNSVTPTTVYGYFITNAAGTVYLMGETFPTPVNLVDSLSFLGVVSEYRQSNKSAGQCTVVS